MASERFRVKFLFWLDVRKGDEYALSEQIEELKQNRSYSKTIRDGIRLICDLRAGRLDVLFELFPWVQVEFLKHMQTLQPVKSETELELERKLNRLEQLMLERGQVPADGVAPAQRMLTIPKPPIAFDDQEAVVIPRDTDSSATFLEDFLNM